MSTTRDEDDDLEPAGHPDLPNRSEGATELSFRESLLVLFYDPDVRNYTIAVLSSLAMIFLVLFTQNSDIGGALIGLVGVAGVLFRWTAAPPLILLLLTYFMIFPFGVPLGAEWKLWEIEDGRFRPLDVILAASVMVYVVSHYRLIGFVHQAMAYDGGAKRRDERPTRRPPALIAPAELGVLLGFAAAFTFLGQLVWLVATSVQINPARDFPIEWVGEGRAMRQGEPFGVAPVKTTTFMILLGLIAGGVLLARVVFGYWSFRQMSPAEGGMILLDGGWDETKRERSRLEKWRAWGRGRAEARAKAAADADLVARAKARAAETRANREQGRREGPTRRGVQ
ncbi:MAG TPA: hypothetical protein VM529_16260 [Gemmata sp.]|nr:hypothetical protein [Gemmata sp.]